MKAILVIDMPATCWDCPCESEYFCGAACKELFYVEDRKPDWCPLKEMPLEMDVDYSKVCDYQDGYYAEGWNDCLEEIKR